MGSESQQHKLDRVRRPRVQITYDVETNGAMAAVELPFLVGVMADLSAGSAKDLPAMKERKFVEIDRDNFNDVLKRSAPTLAMKVPNKLSDDGSQLAVKLDFKSFDDFEPAKVAEQVAPLKELLDVRKALEQILAKLEGNDDLDKKLVEALNDPAKREELMKELGVETPAEE